MSDKEQLRAMAKVFRESADIIDEVAENTDEEREDELLGKFMVKMIKLQKFLENL